MAILKFDNVSVGYEGKAVAEGLSFSIDSGDYLCIVGENGAGKSTLMKTLLSLKAPLSGTIEFSGGLSKDEIGYLPQQTQIQRDFPATVWEVVISGCLNNSGLRPFYSKQQKETAETWLRHLDIAKLKKCCYRELSGGQQQRVLLARALCATKKLIVLDEPVSGLDPIVTADMYSLIKKINKEDGITVVMVSHDIAASLEYATHILQVSGSKTFFGTVEEYKNSDAGKAFIKKAGEGDA